MDSVNTTTSAITNFFNHQLVERTDLRDINYSKICSVSINSDEINSEINKTNIEVNKFQTQQNKFLINKNDTNEFERCSKLISISVYMTWIILMIHAYIREFFRYYGFEKNKAAVERPEQRDFPPLFDSFESIYARNCYKRVLDVFERPICSVPGPTVKLLDRTTKDYCWSFQFTGKQTEIINVGSYNYLGFAENNSICSKNAALSIDKSGISICTTIHEQGMTIEQDNLEKLVAEFLGVDEAICFSMGFATNSMNTSCLANKHSLIISDQYNHASIVLGCRLSNANIKIFKHNDMQNLEQIIRDAIIYGNLKTKRPYQKILILVEGIYSMEGSICNLPQIIALKKKYNCYLYLDEAHSIGAVGQTGRGVVEYWGCSTKDIDILMGTFTKSFGAAGGYLAGNKNIISYLRKTSSTGFYALPMSPPVIQQILTSMLILMGKDGTKNGEMRIERLHRSTRYFRLRLKQMGFIVYGSDDSPVIPIMVYYPTKCGLWGRLMLKRRIGVVVVSFPATEMTESRLRICISASHTKEMLDKVLEAIDEIGDISATKHSKRAHLFKQIKIEW